MLILNPNILISIPNKVESATGNGNSPGDHTNLLHMSF